MTARQRLALAQVCSSARMTAAGDARWSARPCAIMERGDQVRLCLHLSDVDVPPNNRCRARYCVSAASQQLNLDKIVKEARCREVPEPRRAMMETTVQNCLAALKRSGPTADLSSLKKDHD